MSATYIAAWIGALTGTLVLIWDVYKWMQTGSKVKVSAAPNMVAYGSAVTILGDKANCQHKPEPLVLHITYRSGSSGE